MKKIAIVGCPGTGKTTFAKQLHIKTSLPIIHLDYYHHQLQHNYYKDRPAWIARVKSLISTDSWIIEGNYPSTIPERFKAADTIIFFDLPRWLCFYRVVKRRFYYRNKVRDEMPDGWVEKLDRGFIKYVWRFNKLDKPKIVNEINKYKHKNVVIFRNSQDIKRYLEN